MKWAAVAALALAGGLGLGHSLYSGLWRWHAVQSSAAIPTGVRVWLQPGVPASAAEATAQEFARLRTAIDWDFPPHANPTITLQFYATHAAFAVALHRLERLWPERRGDNVGNIVHNVLPLGPDRGLLRHNLAHVYTEWVLDRLTGNTADRQPNPAWLYDGIAEYEADRRSTAVPCRLSAGYIVPLSRITTPADWWRVRGTIYQGLEYCEAEDAVARIIRPIGWSAIAQLLSQHPDWWQFARTIGAGSRS